MKRRTATLASNLMRAINEVIARGFKDPRIRGLVTVTEVVLSEDYKQAKVKVTVFPEEHEALTMHGLKAATPMIRSKAMQRVRIKDMPQLTIVLDEGMKAQANVMALLAKARAEAEQRGVSLDSEPAIETDAALGPDPLIEPASSPEAQPEREAP